MKEDEYYFDYDNIETDDYRHPLDPDDSTHSRLLTVYCPLEATNEQIKKHFEELVEKADKYDNEMLTPKMFDILIHGADITDIPWTERGELDVQRLLDSYKKAERLQAQVRSLQKDLEDVDKCYQLAKDIQKDKESKKCDCDCNKCLTGNHTCDNWMDCHMGVDEP